MSLPNLNAGDLAIGRLRLRAHGQLARGAAAGVRRELERAQWSRVPGDAWVLVRGLSVRGPPGWIGSRASSALEAQMRDAVDAGSPAADQAGAIRFRDLADLLARLCADLAGGRAGTRWYWQTFAALLGLPAGQAIGSLLGGHPQLLATITERLAGLRALVSVWGALSPGQAEDLRHRLSARVGIALPRPWEPDAWDPSLELPEPPAEIRRRWVPALTPVGERDPRRWLAACLVALEWRPLWLGPGSAPVLAALAAALDAPTDTSRPAAASPDRVASIGPQTGRRRSGSRGRPNGESAPVVGKSFSHPFPGTTGSSSTTAEQGIAAGNNGVEDVLGAAVPTAEGWPPDDRASRTRTDALVGARHEPEVDAEDVIDRRIRAPAYGRTLRPAPTPNERRRSDGPMGLSSVADPDSRAPGVGPGISAAPVTFDLETREGGLFYLINFLDRPEARALIAANGGFDRLPDGWTWLWALGRRLGLAPDGTAARFLAERLGLQSSAGLAALPDLPVGDDLMALGDRLYGADRVWNADLLRVPARLRHSPSHLDLDYPLSAVRLEVRQVALDIDPGWVPWLGRVVSFCYLDDWDRSVGGSGSPP